MAREVVEVVARFAGTILDVAHVGPAATYRIGCAPGVDLAVPGVTCFPLVTGDIVRCPIGLAESQQGEATVLRVGALELHITRTRLPDRTLPPPRFELRTSAFLAASLVAHLAIWFAAVRFAPLERLAPPRVRPRLVHLAIADEPRPPAPITPPPPVPTAAPASRAAPVPRGARGRRGGGQRDAEGPEDVVAAARALNATLEAIDLPGRAGEIDAEHFYDPGNQGGGNFGSGRRFDPTRREGWGTVATGPYTLMLYDVTLCPQHSCTVEGPIPALYVRTHLHKYMDAIYACYEQLAPGLGTIVLEMTITADGAVRDARGSGLGETGACAARVASTIYFKALGAETHVRYPMRFN